MKKPYFMGKMWLLNLGFWVKKQSENVVKSRKKLQNLFKRNIISLKEIGIV